MKLDWAGVFADAWGRFKRDRQILLPLAGAFLFLPQLAFYLLVPLPPHIPPGAQGEASLFKPDSPLVVWMTQNVGWMFATVLAMAFGALVVLTLYLGAERSTLASALRRSITLFPRYLLAAIIAGIPAAPIQFALLILIVPCLYLLGRLMLVGPVIVAERPIGVGRAIARSFALTRRRGLVMMGFAGIMIFAEIIIPAPFRLLHDAMAAAQAINPVAVAVLEGLASAAAAAVALATLLVEIAIYRRLVVPSNGT
jgi:hypothetical protein